MSAERRRLPDRLPQELDGAILVARTTSGASATAIERQIKSTYPDALVEIVHQPPHELVVASARGATADALWREAIDAVAAGDVIERRSDGGWETGP